MTIDVWPDLDWSKAIRTPRTVLLEQSQILEAKSKGALRLGVITDSLMKNERYPEGRFGHRAHVHAHKLNYSFHLLAVQHSISSPYPATVIEAGEENEITVESEERFLVELRDILSKPRWINSIDRLIAMGNSQ